MQCPLLALPEAAFQAVHAAVGPSEASNKQALGVSSMRAWVLHMLPRSSRNKATCRRCFRLSDLMRAACARVFEATRACILTLAWGPP